MKIVRTVLGMDWGLSPAEWKRVIGFPIAVAGVASAVLGLLDPFDWVGTRIAAESRDAWTIAIISIVAITAVVGLYAYAAEILAERTRNHEQNIKGMISLQSRMRTSETILAALRSTPGNKEVDALGAGLSSLWNTAHNNLETLAGGSQVRILLLDPSFPDPREGRSFASIQERAIGTPERQIRRDVLRWHSWLVQHTTLQSTVSIRLYRTIPTFGMIRVNSIIVFSPSVLHSNRSNIPAFHLQTSTEVEEETQEFFRTLVDHFSSVWNSPDTRRLEQVPAWEFEMWRSDILVPPSW
ncbi:MAG TPA: hypothetical protein VF615_30420 [Longimicrobiaceae bacterium]